MRFEEIDEKWWCYVQVKMLHVEEDAEPECTPQCMTLVDSCDREEHDPHKHPIVLEVDVVDNEQAGIKD